MGKSGNEDEDDKDAEKRGSAPFAGDPLDPHPPVREYSHVFANVQNANWERVL